MGTLFGDAVHLTDGGMETTLIYHDGIELPDFAAFTVLASERRPRGARRVLRRVPDRCGGAWAADRPRHADVAGELGLGRAARVLRRRSSPT